MYPNPQDVLPLPPHPDIHQYRRRAKDLVHACRTAEEGAIREWSARWIAAVIAHQPEGAHSPRDVQRLIAQLSEFAGARLKQHGCVLAQAQFVIARAHGFESWPKLAHHLEALGSVSAVSAFEEAADAIVDGDLATLTRMLRDQPDLVHAQSTREHRATLLHYVAANGVENYRQITPPNIVEIATLLLDAGAEVDAEANVYGGGATTLGLVATSAHPRLAGVQLELMDLLLARGARLDNRAVYACLMNGCPEAAAHIARLGVHLDIDEAAGIGDLETIDRALDATTAAPADTRRLGTALTMAVWYDQPDAIVLMLDRGVPVDIRHEEDGDTALHIAAYEANVALVDLLLQRGAPVNVIDDRYRTPPIVWALHAWLVDGKGPADRYRATVRRLADAGAEIKLEWIDDERISSDPDLVARLERHIAQE